MGKIVNNKKVVVGMSGGVDSSVAAFLLKKQGFQVIGVFMKYWHMPGVVSENACCSYESLMTAKRAAKKIDIPLYVMDAKKDFKKEVVDKLIAEYKKGNTPNPCVGCNKDIKFAYLIKYADKIGADLIATGHYARIEVKKRGAKKEYYQLLKGKDSAKDQSYFLWQLSQKQLGKIIFPLGDYKKSDVIEIAKKNKIPVSPLESQEICFVSPDINTFLKKYLPKSSFKNGEIIEVISQKVVGKHAGLPFYTIGQRSGVKSLKGILKNTSNTPRFYVISKEMKGHLLYIGDESRLYSNKFEAKAIKLIDEKEDLEKLIKLSARIRYKGKEIGCKVILESKGKTKEAKVLLDSPARAITPGQSVVFYDGDRLIGGGIIK